MSNEKISRSEAKDIATVIMAIHARYIDGAAFEDSLSLVDEDEQQMIIDEMCKISNSMIKRIEKK